MKRKAILVPSVKANIADEITTDSIENRSGNLYFNALSVVVWMACVIPSAVLFLTSTRKWGENITYTPTTQALRGLLLVLVLMVSVVIICRFGKRLLFRPFGTVFSVALLAFYPTGTAIMTGSLTQSQFLGFIITLMVLLALFSLDLKKHDFMVIGVLGGMLGLLSLIMAWVRPSGAYIILSESRILAGPFDNRNYLGIALILLLPFTLLIYNKWLKYTCITSITVPILIGGSDTAIVTFFFIVICWVLVSIIRSPKLRLHFLSWVLVVVFSLSFILPYLVTDPEAFTQRGFIWIEIRNHISELILFGGGHAWFDAHSEQSNFTMQHAHNLFLQPLVIGGVGLLTLEIFLILVVVAYGRASILQGFISPLFFVLALLTAGALGDFFILDSRDLRFFATGFVIMSLLSLATNPSDFPERGQARRSDVSTWRQNK